MMERHVALCVDGVTLRNPHVLGLDGEQLDSQAWLDVYSAGIEARDAIVQAEGSDEVWVVSCDDVEPINLAASLKADRPDLRVCLVSSDPCGSLRSRAHNACIDEVLEQGAFVRRYEEAKRASGVEPTAQLAPVLEREAVRIEPVISVERPQPAPQPHPFPGMTSGRAFVLSVVSGSGGAGKSAVASLGALIARSLGHRTLLLDCDLQFGDVETMVGIENPLRIDEVLTRPESLGREVERTDRLPLIAAPARLETAEEVVSGLPGMLDHLRERCDVIVVNTGAAWAEQHAALLERSSASLFLIDQRASSVRACKHALELCARCGIATNPFQFALNRCAKGAPLTSVDVSCALQGVPVFELRDGGRDVEDYLSSGAASDLLEMKNEFTKSLDQVMRRILPDGIVEATAQVPGETGLALRRKRGRRADKRRGRK